MRLLTTAVVIAVLAAACASGGEYEIRGSAEEPPLPDVASSPSSLPSDGPPIPVEPGDGIGDGSGGNALPDVSPALAAEVDQAIADLASRLGVDTSSITVVVAHELTWPNGSLGCPEPGGMYTQALVDGYRIELSDGGNAYAYHGAVGRPPFLCENVPGGDDGPGRNLIPPTTTP